ncbi:SH3 domain-containing protein [Bacillus sp. D386]|uniref:SH3 domain-containing protein n=1 Tax=Bacillus sp. D386 TaxID=2587155 RepID=UPI00112135C3|nr:SH3 domain-containing protein [Bacillus sp. D386]
MGKYFIKAASLLILLSFIITLLPEKADAASFSSKVNADVLNVRSKATTKSSVIGKIKKGKVVTVQSEQNNWSKITYDKKTGWVMSNYLTYVNWTGYAKVNNLSIKKTASSSAKSLATIKIGTAVSVKGQTGSWVNVYYSSKKITGWVSISSLTKSKPATGTTNLGTYYVTATSLNVRASASTKAKVITTVKKNASVTLQQKSGSWGKVKTSNGKVGWVSLSYLSTKKLVANLGTYYVTASSLTIREKASTKSKVITTVKKNTAVTLQQKSGSWGKVKTSNGKVGWVSLSYLSTKKPAMNLGTYYVTATSLNVREKANTKAKVITTVKKNAAVTLQQKSGTWGKVKTSNGKVGWVSLSYLSTKKPAVNLETYYVTASSLSVRQKADTSSKVITTVKKNAALTLQQKSGTWGKVKTSNGKIGWVAMKHISTKKPFNTKTPQPVSNKTEYLVTNANTSLYKNADSKSTVLASVSKNSSVMKLNTNGSFTQVKLTSGQIGWITSKTLIVSKSVRGKIIVIDPGHGGSDSGAIGVKLKTKEKNINLSTANQLAALLNNAGATVIMTRSNDTFISLANRAALSNSKKADAFLSIHYNAAPDSPTASGIETYYYQNSSLASAIHGELIKATGLKDRKVKQGNFQVIKSNKQPATLLELGFLTNAAEERTISQTSYHKKAAQAIYNGLNVYFKQK